MAEKRSIPTALGILIGPATAYISFLIYTSTALNGIGELGQVLVMACFALAAHDISKGGLSLVGTLFTLLAPALPIALYLRLTPPISETLLSSSSLMMLWAASSLVGAIIAGTQPNRPSTAHLTRLAVLSTLLVAGILIQSFL